MIELNHLRNRRLHPRVRKIRPVPFCGVFDRLVSHRHVFRSAPFTAFCGVLICLHGGVPASATTVSTPFGTSYQVNVDANGQNLPGDAANEPSLCLDPNNPNRIAIGWRQFDSTNSNFRQAGVAYSTNAGLSWTFPGNLEPGTFRSAPVLASDAMGTFYYLGISNANTFACDLLRSTNGGATWQRIGPALGGDKEW